MICRGQSDELVRYSPHQVHCPPHHPCGARHDSDLAPESARDCLDNLSLSGALIYDLYPCSSSLSAATVRALTSQGADAQLSFDTQGDQYLSINDRFTLNPVRISEFDDFTPRRQ